MIEFETRTGKISIDEQKCQKCTEYEVGITIASWLWFHTACAIFDKFGPLGQYQSIE